MSDEIISNKSRDEKLIRIGLNIRKLRRARDITQDDLAKALKVSRSTIGCIESKTNPYRISIDLLLDITEYFGISPSELFEGV
ncbi:MAG: helix-turn-helix transcriptional regulator [Succinatimonas sp.]|nr:helix-turn-helix transcriptional regulator [Succinivibrio sp.]MDD6377833.1 helix-turn-helix transcriptional regulator [Succinatimonas sp.]